MKIPEDIFRNYDIRGKYPDEINDENIAQIVRAIYAFFAKTGRRRIVIGRDMRASSPTLLERVKDVLVECGAAVIDIGMASTPSFYFAVRHFKNDAGIQITASHLPAEYTGMKLVMNSPSGIQKIGRGGGMDEIKKLALQNQYDAGQPMGEHGSIGHTDNLEEVESLDAIRIAKYSPSGRHLKIVADPANSMGAIYIQELFRHTPHSLVRMNFEIMPISVHPADPIRAENLRSLQERVTSEGAYFGIATDGDGDRIFFVDEFGKIVPPSSITALVAREILREHRGEKILFDLRTTITPSRIVEECGGIPIVTKVGHTFITQALNETGGVFAGESSGHFYFRDSGYAESPLIVILTILKIIEREGRPISILSSEVRRSTESGEINFRVADTKKLFENIKKIYSDGVLREYDGIAIDFPTWRFSLRTSANEPLVRLNVEQNIEDKGVYVDNLVAHISKHGTIRT